MLEVMSDAARKLEDALDLADIAEEMAELQFRRLHPQATEAEIEEMVEKWLADRPGARDGDAEGRIVTLPR